MTTSKDNFTVHGVYSVSNAGGYEIEISRDGESARMRDAYGSDSPEISEWKQIEYPEGEPVIDPTGYNIPLSEVIKVK